MKLYGDRLLGSSLMDEALPTRWLMVCFLAHADATGFVRCQTPGAAARLANLTLRQATRALDDLARPDPESTSPAADGARIVRVRGGWQIVNYRTYREMRAYSEGPSAVRMRRLRERRRAGDVTCDAQSPVTSLVTSSSASASLSVEKGGVGGGGTPGTAPAEGFEAAVWDAFRTRFQLSRFAATSSELYLAGRWRESGAPLAVVLRGIEETGGSPRNLHACEAPVRRAIEYWRKAKP